MLDIRYFLIANTLVGRFNHRIDQIQVLAIPFSRFHRTTRYKYGRNIQTHSRHQHSRSNLIAIADTYHCIRLMCIDHIFHAVCNDVT